MVVSVVRGYLFVYLILLRCVQSPRQYVQQHRVVLVWDRHHSLQAAGGSPQQLAASFSACAMFPFVFVRVSITRSQPFVTPTSHAERETPKPKRTVARRKSENGEQTKCNQRLSLVRRAFEMLVAADRSCAVSSRADPTGSRVQCRPLSPPHSIQQGS